MILITLEKREHLIKILIRDSSKIQPLTEIRSVKAEVFAQFAKDWESLYQRSEALMLRGQTSSLHEIETKVRRKGKVLSTLIFGKHLPNWNGPLVLSVDSALSAVPFEILHDGSGFLCDRVSILREVVAETVSERPKGYAKNRDLALLLMNPAFSPEVAESVKREKDELLKLFRTRSDVTTKVIQTKPVGSTLLEDLLEARFLHYSGHHEQGRADDGAFLVPGEFAGSDLTHLEVVFINACHSAIAGDATLASALVKSGVQHFVGFGLSVETKRAETISKLFWSRVLAGGKVPDVVKNVRAEIRELYRGSLEWASIQHFGTIQNVGTFRFKLKAALAMVGVVGIAVLAGLFFLFKPHPVPGVAVNLPQGAENQKQQAISPHPNAAQQTQSRRAPEPVPDDKIPVGLRAVFESYPQVMNDPLLGEQVIAFYRQPHPVYSELRRIEIIKETLDLDVSSAMKIVRIRSEMGKR